MKAIVFETYGPAEVLSLADVDRPAVGNDDVLLRVHAAGVDRGVWHMMTGLPYLIRLAVGLRAPKPRYRVLGADVAGVVEATGANVTGFQPGDRVFGTCEGAYAEFARTGQDKLVPMPESLAFEQAAAIPASGVTALKALRDWGRVRPGQRVLVIGAGGGVGTFAVQLANAFGAEVTGVCSTAKVDLVRSIGAAEVIDYTREDFADGPRRYDLIVDIAGGRSLSHLRRALSPRGTLVRVGAEDGGRWLGGLRHSLRALLLNPFVRHRLLAPIALVRKEHLQVLVELVCQGKLAPVIETYPLSDTPEAIARLTGNRIRGKAVITVS